MSEAAKKLISPNQASPLDAFRSRPATQMNWRVLIVEDEPSIAHGIKNILTPAGNVVPITTRSSRQVASAAQAPVQPAIKDQFEVTWAKNPKEALELVKNSILTNRPFALGFFDVLLGADIDGIELVKQIHQIDPKIYAVFVTAYHDRTVDSINQVLGPDKSDRWDYMNKPFTDGAILQKARNAVSTWNLRDQKERQDSQLAEAANLLLQGERANTVAAVGRSVAHEFGNLLMQIIGNADIALLNSDVTTMHNSLKTILRAGETASAVLEKFKKIQTGENKRTEMKKINVTDCLNEAVELMGHELRKRNIQVTRIKNDVVEVEANYHSLVQVLINVLINACHVMPTSGQIDLSVIDIGKSPTANGDSGVRILVRDHGPGVPEKDLSKVMNPFFTTKGNKGTGLGLPICREIIEGEHNGIFKLENHPSKGVQVTIQLPLKQEGSHE
jgi:signal transduction histidine kinase